MKTELQTLIELLEAEIERSEDGDLVPLLDRARALDTLDETELAILVGAAHRTVEHMAAERSDAEGGAARKLLEVLGGV